MNLMIVLVRSKGGKVNATQNVDEGNLRKRLQSINAAPMEA